MPSTDDRSRRGDVDTAADSLRTWIYAPHTEETFAAHDRAVTGLRLVR